MKVSVIIVNWNTRDLLFQCLDSIYRQEGNEEFEVIVVDNASSDGSTSMIKDRFERVVLVENEKNVGFPRANNQVLSHARGDYIFFLNPDTVVVKETIRDLVDFLDRNDDYGAAGPKVTRPDGTIQMECACNVPTLSGIFFDLTRLSRLFPRSRFFGQWRMTYWDHQDDRDVACLIGAAIMVRREVMRQIGTLDEHMYVEDVDLCHRIGSAGWKIRYLSGAEIVHHDGASRKAAPGFYHHYQIAWHGVWHFLRKHRGNGQALLFRGMTFAISLVGLVVYSPAWALAFFNKPLAAGAVDKSRKAWAVLLWSLTPPSHFRVRFSK